ncbi:MAG: heavy metal-binding domain-containing protein [Streptosporangiaceae bacterium]
MRQHRHTVDFPVTTALQLPGMRVKQSFGIAFGLVVRSVGLAKGIVGGLRSLRRGETAAGTPSTG